MSYHNTQLKKDFLSRIRTHDPLFINRPVALQTEEFNLPVTSRLDALNAAKMYFVQWRCCV